MKTIFPFCMLLFLTFSGQAQKKIDRTLRLLNNESVPYIQVSEANSKDNLLYLDARKKAEYEVSHLKDAIWVGYDEFDPQRLMEFVRDTSTTIVVYCSVGVRSEDIGEKLQALGYTNVYNLYGGIFKWKNSGLAVFDTVGKETNRVHAYNRLWGKLLTKGEKVYN